MAASVKHSVETNEQYTPVDILDRVREVLGSIDTDPATSELANTRVGAKKIYTEEDGEKTFKEPWRGNVFLNPPGGQRPVVEGVGIRSNPTLFWAKLMHGWQKEGTVQSAIFLGFTMEVLQSSQSVEEFSYYPMLRFPFCVPSRRISFDIPREEKVRQLEQRLAKADDVKKRKTLKAKLKKLKQSSEPIVRGSEPPHGNVLILVPPLVEHFFGLDTEDRPWVGWQGPVTQRFYDVFSELGYVRI